MNAHISPRPPVSGIIGTACQIVPVLALDEPDSAEPVLEALDRAGLSVVEVTLRTPAALKVIERMAKVGSRVAVGAGTLTRPEHFRQVVDAGAVFTVSPALTDPIYQAAVTSGVPFLPAVATPTEALHARELGFRELKFFPAGLMGGPAWLTHLLPIYPDLSFCVTGGVTDDNVRNYLDLGNCFGAGGAYIAPKAMIAARDWAGLTAAASRSVAAAAPR